MEPPQRPSKRKAEPGLAARALRFLARREHSRAELARKLAPHSQDPAELERVLDDLAQRGWLSDARFAEQYVHSKRGRYGPARLRQALLARGVGREAVEAAVRDARGGEMAAAQSVWSAKFGTPPPSHVERARQVRFLQSRGFSAEIALRVVRGGGAADGE